MDSYTLETKKWLDSRFTYCDAQGIYQAHQPIYGFRKGHCDLRIMDAYVRTFQIVRALSHLKFDSLLDVGGAEGYKAYIIKQLFGVAVKSSDISDEACRRAGEIFNIESVTADIHNLPFKNNEYDVLVCSETIEHVTDHQKAVSELLRVARKAVIITVPHESHRITDRSIHEAVPHGHINSFNSSSFDYLKSQGYDIRSKKIVSPLLTIPGILFEAMPLSFSKGTRYPEILFRAYNSFVPLLRKLFDEKASAFLIKFDEVICRITLPYRAALFVILKDQGCHDQKSCLRITPARIMSFTVPFHRIDTAKYNANPVK